MMKSALINAMSIGGSDSRNEMVRRTRLDRYDFSYELNT